MKTVAAVATLLGVWLAVESHLAGTGMPWREAGTVSVAATAVTRTPTEVIERYCVRCHNERRLAGNLTLETLSLIHI